MQNILSNTRYLMNSEKLNFYIRFMIQKKFDKKMNIFKYTSLRSKLRKKKSYKNVRSKIDNFGAFINLRFWWEHILNIIKYIEN